MKFRTFAFIATPFIGYYYIDTKLSSMYPDIPLSQLPKNSKLKNYMQNSIKKSNEKYFAYSDIYKTTIESNSIEEINDNFLTTPGISNLVNNRVSSSAFESKIVDIFDEPKKGYKSTLIEWSWCSNLGIVSFFEKLSKYGYPWRIMNGGLHEIYIEKSKNSNKSDEYDVWFSTTHEYNNHRDGKLIPEWVQSLHRNYARMLLYLATQK